MRGVNVSSSDLYQLMEIGKRAGRMLVARYLLRNKRGYFAGGALLACLLALSFSDTNKNNCAMVASRLQTKRSGPTCDTSTKSALNRQPFY